MDLRANGAFQYMFDGKKFADQLRELNISPHVMIIDLYVSEIRMQNGNGSTSSLSDFAIQLSHGLKDLCNQDVIVTTVSNPNYATTLLVSPQKTGQWQVFGIQSRDVKHNFDAFCQLSKKDLLWEGKDLEDYLLDLDRMYAPWALNNSKLVELVRTVMEPRVARKNNSASNKFFFELAAITDKREQSAVNDKINPEAKHPRLS